MINQINKIDNKSQKLICYHCGEICSNNEIESNGHIFCCNGCKTVYEMLNANNLCNYYELEKAPGVTPPKPVAKHKYNFLDDPDFVDEFIDFKDDKIIGITFSIPKIGW